MKCRFSAEIMRSRLYLLTLVALAAAAAGAQHSPKVQRSHATSAGATAGQKTFSSRCAGCHGLDGRGSQRAPNIASNPTTRRLSDPELTQIILNGRTDFGMPSFRE